MSVFDPRIDERPPGYAKGQWFGGVPHSRVIVFLPAATGVFAWLRDGIVIPLVTEIGTDTDNGYAEWMGEVTVDGVVFTVRWIWFTMVAEDGTCRFVGQVQAAGFPFETFASEEYFRPSLASAYTMTVGYDDPAGSSGGTLTKWDVPEWSDVVERWPDAIPSV